MPVPWCPDIQSVPRSWRLTDNRPFLQPKPEKHIQVRTLTGVNSKCKIIISEMECRHGDLREKVHRFYTLAVNKNYSQDLQSNYFLFPRHFLKDLHGCGDFIITVQEFLLWLCKYITAKLTEVHISIAVTKFSKYKKYL